VLLLLSALGTGSVMLLAGSLFKERPNLKRTGVAAGALFMLTIVSACGIDSAADEVQTPSDLESEQAEVKEAEEAKEEEERLAAEQEAEEKAAAAKLAKEQEQAEQERLAKEKAAEEAAAKEQADLFDG